MIGENELQRLEEDKKRTHNWKRWGPYLSERQWGTVREDYSEDGNAWRHFPFEHAHLRTYRWGEDGLLGFCDRQGRLCFSPAFWNGNDPIIKERLFGLTGEQGNHGEDNKELYYYLDSSPTHTYSKALYKYPHSEYPYKELIEENQRRGLDQPEYEILDTGAFNNSKSFDIQVEYAKASPDDILIQISITNLAPTPAKLTALPKLWFRNTWVWGCEHEGCSLKPTISRETENKLRIESDSLGTFYFEADVSSNGLPPKIALAENETSTKALYGTDNYTPYTKDSFHRWIVESDETAVMHEGSGTMAMVRYDLNLAPQETVSLRLRLYSKSDSPSHALGPSFDSALSGAKQQVEDFWQKLLSKDASPEEREIQRQAYAGLLWTKQFYHYSVHDWLKGDSSIAETPESRKNGRNHNWTHLFNRDVISMPDKWEYPWYAAWDTAFHMIPFAEIDPDFAKDQLILFLREWYMHPNGQIPAYEWALDDVNPPTHAWACWEVYAMGKRNGAPDIDFLKRVFTKLLLNFTWWVNRKDTQGNNLFGGGFLGLDNIGLFDRSKPLPGGAELQQADGTAWMAFYCTQMLSISLELAASDRTYSDVASKFFEHFMSIADASNHFADRGLWDDQDGFYYDEIVYPNGESKPLRLRSLVGLLPLIAALPLRQSTLDILPGFRKRMDWYLKNRKDITRQITAMSVSEDNSDRLLALPTKERLLRLLAYLFDEKEFLSPYGIRSLSKAYDAEPYRMNVDGQHHELRYRPGDSDTHLFGGNSNWRGPIWFPANYLIIQALDRYHDFYGDSLQVEYPTGSGNRQTLQACADDIRQRLYSIFKTNPQGQKPWQGENPKAAELSGADQLQQFYEFFNPENGKGHGASHQTGWTALVATLIREKYQD